jgi:zinc/manganese transport system ATP-binding protein
MTERVVTPASGAPAAPFLGDHSALPSSVVSAHDLAASYRHTPVWSGATFDVAPGEFIAVLGPNGAGKSTLLLLLLGLLRPAAGSLTVLGEAPRRGNPAIGYVPQRRPIDPDLRLAGAEFVKLGLSGHRWGIGWPAGRAELDRRVAEAAAAVGAEAYLSHAVGTLSGGELQRLMLAQAIVSDPRLLLLDEPLASLDVRNQVGAASLVAGLTRSRGIAVLLIAHDVNPLLPVLDRVMYVARGKVTIGRPDEVITSEHLSSLYEANVEVLRDSHGRLFVVGLDDEAAHPHDRHTHGAGAGRRT